MTKVKRYIKDNLGIIAALAVMIIFLYVFPRTHNTFLTQTNIFNVLRQSSTNLMLACGMTMVIILGGIDLSVGSIIAMSGVLGAAAVVWHGMPEIVGILIAILSGVIFGLLNGLVIAKTKIPPFIVTLASMNIAKGIAYVYSGGKPIRCMTDAWKFLGAGYVGPIPTPVITMTVVFIVSVLFLNRTKMGRHVYAVGGSEQSAKLMGLPVGKTKIAVYAINGFCSAMCGITYLLTVKSGWNMALQGGELEVISCAVIGGTLLTGGVGYMIGTMFGVLLKSVIPALISFNGTLSSWWGKIATGALLLLFIVIQRLVVSSSSIRLKKK